MEGAIELTADGWWNKCMDEAQRYGEGGDPDAHAHAHAFHNTVYWYLRTKDGVEPKIEQIEAKKQDFLLMFAF